MTVAIIDYGMGNLGSVRRALAMIGTSCVIVDEPDALAEADRIILPGVGGFADGMEHLDAGGWPEAIRQYVIEHGKPILGICLGMQLLAMRGTEGRSLDGIGLLPGEVVRLDALGCRERIPHVGWNDIRVTQRDNPLLAGIDSGTDFYFVHSYALPGGSDAHVLAESSYGVAISAVMGRGHAWGTQFHPEKSSRTGLRLLKNFVDAAPC